MISAAFIALITWWRAPFVHLHGRMDNSVYDSEGVVVFGYTLFALGLAAAVGVVWRRAVPALVVAYVGYFASRLFVDTWLRQRLISPLSATFAPNRGPDLDHAWVLSEYPSDRLGHPSRTPRGTVPAGGGGHARPRQGRRRLPARGLSPREPLLAAAADRDRALRRRRTRADRLRGLVDAAADSLSTLPIGDPGQRPLGCTHGGFS